MQYVQWGGILKYGDLLGGFLKYGDLGTPYVPVVVEPAVTGAVAIPRDIKIYVEGIKKRIRDEEELLEIVDIILMSGVLE